MPQMRRGGSDHHAAQIHRALITRSGGARLATISAISPPCHVAARVLVPAP
jgi:hypothetical protein